MSLRSRVGVAPSLKPDLLLRLQPQMASVSNGFSPKWLQPRMATAPNGYSPQWPQPQMAWAPNGCTRALGITCHTGGGPPFGAG